MEIEIKWLNSNGMERYHILTQPHKLFPLANRGNNNLWSSVLNRCTKYRHLTYATKMPRVKIHEE